MDSNTSAIIIAILVALLVSTIVYLSHLVRVLRQARRQQTGTPSGLESNQAELNLVNVPDITIKDASELACLDLEKEPIGVDKEVDIMEESREHHLSTLTDTSVVSSSPSTVSKENVVQANDISNVVKASKLEGPALPSASHHKLPPACPYKGKIPCTCQQTRGSMDLLRHHHNSSHTYPRTMQSTSSSSSGRRSTSVLESSQYSDLGKEKVHQWISGNPPTSLRDGRVPNHQEEDDDDQPVINQLKTGNKEGSVTLSNPRSRTRPSSPLSPHRSTASGIVYPNQTFSDHHRWVPQQNINNFAYSPSWPNMPFYYAPTHLMAPNSPSHKSRPVHLAKKSEDYYQQRVV
jgi:hypothetical protein